LRCVWVEKLRWLISEIFTNIRSIDTLLGLKFDNINALKMSEGVLKIDCSKDILKQSEINRVKDIIAANFNCKDIIFTYQEFKIVYPYPVLNSKFNNFITKVIFDNGKFILQFYQKDSGKFYESTIYDYVSVEDFLDHLKSFAVEKLPLLADLYRFNQIVLPFYNFLTQDILYITDQWISFISKKGLSKNFDKLYFSLT